MPSAFVQKQVERYLSEAEAAIAKDDWAALRSAATRILALDPQNSDAPDLPAAAERALGGTGNGGEPQDHRGEANARAVVGWRPPAPGATPPSSEAVLAGETAGRWTGG